MWTRFSFIVLRGANWCLTSCFPDKCFLFYRAKDVESQKLLNILKIYEETYGQEITLAKSEVFFSPNMCITAQADLFRMLGVPHLMGTIKYLGLPSLVDRNNYIFGYVKNIIWMRINSWWGRALSKAGKEVMIKDVLQAIPSYIMSMDGVGARNLS